MRYRIVLIPFMGHVHVTLTHIPHYGEKALGSEFFDVGPEDVNHPEELAEVLAYVAQELRTIGW